MQPQNAEPRGVHSVCRLYGESGLQNSKLSARPGPSALAATCYCYVLACRCRRPIAGSPVAGPRGAAPVVVLAAAATPFTVHRH